MLTTYAETPAHSSFEVDDELFEMVNDDDKKKFLCKYAGCGKFFRYKSEIVRHAATHSESRPFICQYDNCYKAFKRNDALENHIRSSHTKETPFVCPVADCGAKFTTHGSFRYHVLKHNKQGHDIPEHHIEEDPAHKQMKLNQSINNPFAYQGKALKYEPNAQHLVEQALTKEFFEPAPRFASGLKWEMLDDEETDNSPQENEIQSGPAQVDLAQENSLLKQKLADSESIIQNMQQQMNQMMNELAVYRSQVDFGNFGSFNDQSQSTPSDFSQKQEANLDMINYSEPKNLPSPAAGLFIQENNSIDFLSFNQELTNFDF